MRSELSLTYSHFILLYPSVRNSGERLYSVHGFQILVPVFVLRTFTEYAFISALEQNIPKPVCRINAALIIVRAKYDLLQIWMRFKCLQDGFLVHAVCGNVAMLLPVLREQCQEAEHVNRRFKDVQPPRCTEVREAVPGIRAFAGHPESGTLRVGGPLVRLPGSTLFIESDKDCIVMRRILVERVQLGKMRDDLRRNISLLDEIGVHPMHVRIWLRQLENGLRFGLGFTRR